MPIPFLATEISGLADPSYPSGGANKNYVDDISGAVVTWATNEFYNSEGDLTGLLDDNYAPSSATKSHIDDSTIHYTSGQLEGLFAPTGAAGDISSQVTLSSGLTSDANIYHDGESTQMYLDDIPQGVLKSGAEYYKGYESGQILEAGAFINVASGWESVADTGTIAHGLGAIPAHVTLTPSGTVTFAIAFTVDSSDITVRMSAAGNRVVNWRAEV